MSTVNSTFIALVLLAGITIVSCNDRYQSASNFIVVRSDRTISGKSLYPLAVNPERVGTYSPDTHSGGGYFYDDVLEYRVWLNPKRGAEPFNGKSDY